MVATETAMPVSPKNPIDTAVATDAARIFTTLFPTRMVIKNLSGVFFRVARASDPCDFSFTRVLTLALVIVNNATSEPEKKPDRMRQKTKIIMYM